MILKCTKHECSEDFGNYIRKLAAEAIKIIPENELEDVIWGQYYPENMRSYLRNENLSVVIFKNDDELCLRHSRSIVKNELIKYSGHMIEDF